jgi:hypothetical protein
VEAIERAGIGDEVAAFGREHLPDGLIGLFRMPNLRNSQALVVVQLYKHAKTCTNRGYLKPLRMLGVTNAFPIAVIYSERFHNSPNSAIVSDRRRLYRS